MGCLKLTCVNPAVILIDMLSVHVYFILYNIIVLTKASCNNVFIQTRIMPCPLGLAITDGVKKADRFLIRHVGKLPA